MDPGVSVKFAVALMAFGTLVTCQVTTDPTPPAATSSTTKVSSSPPSLETTTASDKVVAMTTSKSTATSAAAPSSTTTTTATTTTTTASTTTPRVTTESPQTSTEWQDMDDLESEKLVNFVVAEIQKLKMEHKELDECQELDLSSVLSGKKLEGKSTKYSITLKVQPQIKNTEACLKQNSTMNNMHPEICEADVTEGDHGGTEDKTLLRSTCLQVEELQD